jgi:hypothetical protein
VLPLQPDAQVSAEVPSALGYRLAARTSPAVRGERPQALALAGNTRRNGPKEFLGWPSGRRCGGHLGSVLLPSRQALPRP